MNAKNDLSEIEFQREKVNIDYSIIHVIRYCEENKANQDITDGLKNLLVYGTEEEKKHFFTSNKYILSERFFELKVPDIKLWSMTHMTRNGVGMCEQICSKWETKTVCRDKELWQTACVFGTVVCYAAAGSTCGPAGAVCTLVNRIVSECIDVPVCVETQEICAPGY